MNRVFHKLLRLRYELALVAILLILFIQNITPGTWLSGWDNLHPEFDFGMNIYRSIFSVWEEYQGLGLLAGMAHASDLPRQIFLWIVSFILPGNLIRYFYHFLMLGIGTFGAYTLLYRVTLSHHEQPLRQKGAWIGALFYLLNIGTVQYFYTPFEPYSTFWGMFPWETYTLLCFLHMPSRRNALWFAGANLLAIPQAYVQTIFLVYILCVGIILGIFFLTNRTIQSLALSLKVIAIICAINAFWLLPNLYFVLHDVSVTQNAIHNQLDTEKFFEMNKRRGTLPDGMLLHLFGYDLFDTDPGRPQPYFLLQAWHDYHTPAVFTIIGLSFFALVILGLFNKHPYRKYLVGLFVFSGIILLSDTPFIAEINQQLRTLPLVSQALRNPFSKVLVPFILVYSLFFSLGISSLLAALIRKKLKIWSWVLYAGVLLMLVYYSFPAFNGFFISPKNRVIIPHEYFDLFTYFKTQNKNARIMNLPQDSFWGWGSYQWGYTGSGFLWYGIEQPILDRAFDVWSNELEGYYWELSYALQKKDVELFNTILEKYQISFILFDPYYVPSDSSPYKTLYQQHDTFLTNNSKVKHIKQFGWLSVYQTQLVTKQNNNIFFSQQLPRITQPEPFSHVDLHFMRLGHYRVADNSPSLVLPFQSLFTNRQTTEQPFQIREDTNTISLSATIPKGTYTLSYPSVIQSNAYIPINIFAKEKNGSLLLRFETQEPTIRINNQTIRNDPFVQEALIPMGPRSESTLVMTINNQDVLFFNAASPEFTFVGTTYLLNADEANIVYVYSTTNAEKHEPAISDFSPGQECAPTTNPEKQAYTIRKNDTIVLRAKNTAVCTLQQDILPPSPQKSLLGVSFDYRSESDEFPQYCLSSDERYTCLNTQQASYPQFGFSNEWNHSADFFQGSVSSSSAVMQLILEGKNDEDKNKEKQMSYKNIEVSQYPLVAAVSPFESLSTIKTSSTQLPITLEKASTIEVILPAIPNALTYPNLLSKRLYRKTPIFPANSPIKGEAHIQELVSPYAMRLYAKDTFSQAWIKLPQLPINLGYVLSVDTKNVSGSPLVLNVFSHQDAIKYLHALIKPTAHFTANRYIIPPFYEFDQGLQIALMSQSFNRTPSVNDIRSISIYPIPFDFLKQISLTPLRRDNIPVFATTAPSSVTKHNPSLYYEVKTNGVVPQTIVLSQSYDSGWHAYEIKNSESGIMNYAKKTFPFLFGTEIKEHVRVNNWANGWVLNNETIEQLSNGAIVILYLPQYLEYLGLGLLVIMGILIFRRIPRISP